jgi:DNA-binding GntR family transcriptional regulator
MNAARKGRDRTDHASGDADAGEVGIGGEGRHPRSVLLQPGRRSGLSLMEQAYARLRREILSCRLPPGAEISETDIAEHLQMSKSPVREALGRLRMEGFVRAYPRRGYQIAPLTLSDLKELLELRTILETGAVTLAAARISPEEVARLTQLADADDLAPVDRGAGLDAFVDANRAFHAAVASASGNRRVVEQIILCLDGLERFFYVGARSRDISPQTRAEHAELIEALRAGDGARARQLVVAHNDRTRDGLIEVISAGASPWSLR